MKRQKRKQTQRCSDESHVIWERCDIPLLTLKMEDSQEAKKKKKVGHIWELEKHKEAFFIKEHRLPSP